MRVVVASRNRHKLREIGVLLADVGLAWDLVSIDEVAPECALVEDEPSFEGNALSKARQAAAATGLPALADDSGIEVDALYGAPGVYSARWSGEPSRVGSGRALLAADHRARPSEASGVVQGGQEPRVWKPSQGFHYNPLARRRQRAEGRLFSQARQCPGGGESCGLVDRPALRC